MKKTINKPEVKVVKLQKMNVIATSGGSGSSGPHRASANTATVIVNDMTGGDKW